MKPTREFFQLLFIQSVVPCVLCLGGFNCTKNGPIYRGMCSIASDICCESVAGHSCKKEMSQNWEEFSPQLHFLDNSLVIEYRPNLPTRVCIQGANIDKGNGFKGTETKGIYIEVTFRNTPEHEYVYSSTTLFPGRISRTALRNSLNCVEVDMSEEKLAVDTNYIRVSWVPLPVAPDREFPQEYPHPGGTDNFMPVCDITNVRIYWSSCFKWNQHVLPTKSCIRTATVTTDQGHLQSPEPNVITDPGKVRDPFWLIVSIVLITAVISCSCYFVITICVFCTYKHRRQEQLQKFVPIRPREQQTESDESSQLVATQSQSGHQNSMSCQSLQPESSLPDSNLGAERYSGISRGLQADSLELTPFPKTESVVESVFVCSPPKIDTENTVNAWN